MSFEDATFGIIALCRCISTGEQVIRLKSNKTTEQIKLLVEKGIKMSLVLTQYPLLADDRSNQKYNLFSLNQYPPVYILFPTDI